MRREIRFPPFRLSPETGRLLRRDAVVPLRPKAFAVLCYLAERPERLVTKSELLCGVWPETHVSEGVLKVCIREVREVLGDTARTPAFIETVHRRGYRFVAPTEVETAPELDETELPAEAREAHVVGRERELVVLTQWLERALEGRRQIALIAGEAGIGKTTLLEAFLARAAGPAVWIARGQCVDHYGPGEAFFPVLEALGRLGRGPAGRELVPLLREHAPSWLLEIPGIVGATERHELQRAYAGSGRERMLRELVVGLEVVSAVRPLVLALEDLHWSDASTLDLLAALARGRTPARLLVLGTYRPEDVAGESRPLAALVRELVAGRFAAEMALGPLDPAAVESYLRSLFADEGLAATLAGVVHRHSDGHPLFMASIVEHLVSHGIVVGGDGAWRLAGEPADVEREASQSLRDIVGSLLERLEPGERHILGAASLMGLEFATPPIAAALGEDLEQVEASCAALARRRTLVRPLAEATWPDGKVAARYRFRHVLYRDLLEEGVPPASRRRLHRRLGESLERSYRERRAEIATQLAHHFEHGGDAARAIRYLHVAGDRATGRHAYHAAIGHLRRALELLDGEDPGPERSQRELLLRVSLGTPLLAARGFGGPEVGETYARALELCRELGETPQLFPVLQGLQAFYSIAGELETAHVLSRQMLRLGERTGDPLMALEASHAMGCDLLRLAELGAAREHFERALALYDPERGEEAFRWSGHDSKTCCLSNLSVVLHYCGLSDQALRRARQALDWAGEKRHPIGVVQARTSSGWVHLLRREPAPARAHLEAVLELTSEYDLPYWGALAMLLRAWAIAQQGEIEEAEGRLEEAWSVLQLIGPKVGEADYRVLRAIIGVLGGGGARDVEETARALELVRARGEAYHVSSLYQCLGELRLQAAEHGGGRPEDLAAAEESLQTAAEVARRQGALSFELSATLRLAGLHARRGERERARAELGAVYGRFREGLDTPELREAAARLRDWDDATVRP